MEGYLSKLSSSAFVGWQSKYFCLENTKLKYNSKKEKKYIDMSQTISVGMGMFKDKDTPPTDTCVEFFIEQKDHIYELRALNTIETKAWVECLSVFSGCNTNPRIPSMIQKAMLGCLNHIEQCEMVEGIFRLSPTQEDLRKLYHEVLVNGAKAISEKCSVITVAAVFKRLLRTLPQSLLTDSLLQHFLDASRDFVSTKALMGQLPSSNRVLLRRLAEVCAVIVEDVNVTKMETSQLSTCLGPSFITSSEEDKTKNFKPFFDIIIEHRENLFHNFAKVPIDMTLNNGGAAASAGDVPAKIDVPVVASDVADITSIRVPVNLNLAPDEVMPVSEPVREISENVNVMNVAVIAGKSPDQKEVEVKTIAKALIQEGTPKKKYKDTTSGSENDSPAKVKKTPKIKSTSNLGKNSTARDDESESEYDEVQIKEPTPPSRTSAGGCLIM